MKNMQELFDERCSKSGEPDRKELVRQATEKVNEAISAIFRAIPTVNIIAVEGHIPHFNDGDVCRWGMNHQIDVVGECYHTALWKEIEKLGMEVHSGKVPDPAKLANTKYAKLLSRTKMVPYDKQAKLLNFQLIVMASKLLNSYSKEFEIIDNEANGTSWLFIRNQDETAADGFKTVVDHYEHD